jgi:putative transposase
MIDRQHPLPLGKQTKALGMSRGSVYHLPRPVPAADLAIMNRLDKLDLEHPFAGSRLMRDFLVREGHKVGRLHVATLMKRMGIEAIYRRPNSPKLLACLIRRFPAAPRWRGTAPRRSSVWRRGTVRAPGRARLLIAAEI